MQTKITSVPLRLKNGKIIDLHDLKEFYVEEMDNANRIYRFGARVDFTVFDHINLGCLLCDKDEQRLFIILHECFEICASGLDVPTPLKKTWPWYIEQENKYLEFVYGYHGLDWSKYTDFVKEIDYQCYLIEEQHFFYNNPQKEIIEVLRSNWLPLSTRVKRMFPEIYK